MSFLQVILSLSLGSKTEGTLCYVSKLETSVSRPPDMPLDDINNTSQQASLRLAKLDKTPGTTDLDLALSQAKKNTSAVIELPWKSHSSPTFVLKVSCFDEDQDANWVLYQGETADAAILWSFDSDDTTLIESLIAAESGSDRGSDRGSAGAAAPSQSGSGAGSGHGGLSLSVSSTAPLGSSAPVVPPAAPPPPPPPPRVARIELPPPVDFDRSMVDEIDRSLRNPDTGIITRAGFFYFMSREFARWQSLSAPMAVLIFELLANYGNDKIMPMPERALKEAFRRFGGVTRGVDILSHYKEKQFAFLLPGLSANEAVQFGQRVEKVLLEGPLQPGLDASQAILCAGVAAIPDTCDHPGVVLAACEKALQQARERKTSLALYPSAAAR